MAFRARPLSEVVDGKCWCGSDAITTTFAADDVIRTCTADIFHWPDDSTSSANVSEPCS